MNNINSETGLYLLLGNPVKHSLSPLFQNYMLMNSNINALYLTSNVNHSELQDAIKAIKSLKVLGANITVPFKESVIKYLDIVDNTALQIGAVNTIVNNNGILSGYNTDVVGFIKLIEFYKINIEDYKISVWGAGGASKAIIKALEVMNVKEISIFNRTVEKISELENISDKVIIKKYLLNEYSPSNNELIINTTSIGHIDTIPSYFYDIIFNSTQVFIDLNYSPEITKFMQLVSNYDVKSYNGLVMLIAQGIESFKLWSNRDFSLEDAYFHVQSYLDGGTND